MANIELVIKMDEKDYDFVKRQVADGITNPLKICIANGTLLPKGHGDLKNMNDLCYKSRYGCESNCDYLHTCNLYKASTIIEADKSEGKLEQESALEIKTVTNAEEAEVYPISENISKGFEEFTRMMFKQGQAESEVKE